MAVTAGALAGVQCLQAFEHSGRLLGFEVLAAGLVLLSLIAAGLSFLIRLLLVLLLACLRCSGGRSRGAVGSAGRLLGCGIWA